MGSRTVLGTRLVPGQGVRITIRVYDYVPVDPEVLARAERVSDAIFEETGIEITWMDCTPLRGEFLPHETCPSDMKASDLVLRLLPRRMAMKLAAPSEPLGFAQQCPETEPACELTVFYFRVEELAAEGHRPELILGHVIAHEVAHVLIGPGHSEVGIMRREWSRVELRRMSLGLQLGFTGAQSLQLQDAVLRRTKQAIRRLQRDCIPLLENQKRASERPIPCTSPRNFLIHSKMRLVTQSCHEFYRLMPLVFRRTIVSFRLVPSYRL